MEHRKVSFPVLKAARWASASTDDESDSTFEDWVLWVRVTDLPLDLPLDPNARHPDIDNRVARAIEATLLEEPSEFVKRNSGLCLVVHRCSVRDNVASIDLRTFDTREERDEGRRGDGVLNGGHTYAVIRRVLSDRAGEREFGDAVVRLEVQTGIPEESLADISRARNLSTPVEEFSLKNLAREWESLKRELPRNVRENIAFMENDPEAEAAEYDVGDLVQLLALFNSKLYPVRNTDPLIAFTSEKRLVARWKSSDFALLIPQISSILRFHDLVALRFAEVMSKKKGRKFDAFENHKRKARTNVLLGGTKTTARIPSAFMFPVLAALRVFLAEDGSGWRVAPETLIANGLVDDLINTALELYRGGSGNIAYWGRTRSNWENLRQKALIAMLDPMT